MSFSSDIKERLCKEDYDCPRCALYEASGALIFGGSITETEIRFKTEHGFVAERVGQELYEAFGIRAEHTRTAKQEKLTVSNVFEVENITGGILSGGNIPFSCCRAAFVRGAFLGGGSVTDPQKGYHMEFNARSLTDAQRLTDILTDDGFDARITTRKGNNVVYIKGSESIAGIMGYMGAPQGALELFTIQVEREMRNDINRRVNCENANTNKAARASSRHLFAIKKIRAAGMWEKLPAVLKEIAELREEYPEDSLKELGERTSPKLGKSGVNHRLNRILEIAENI